MKKITQDAKTFAQEKELYIAPLCAVISMEQERFFCTSVVPGKNPKEDDWGEDEDIDGGDNDIEL